MPSGLPWGRTPPFEHSLGVHWLADKAIDIIKKYQDYCMMSDMNASATFLSLSSFPYHFLISIPVILLEEEGQKNIYLSTSIPLRRNSRSEIWLNRFTVHTSECSIPSSGP